MGVLDIMEYVTNKWDLSNQWDYRSHKKCLIKSPLYKSHENPWIHHHFPWLFPWWNLSPRGSVRPKRSVKTSKVLSKTRKRLKAQSVEGPLAKNSSPFFGPRRLKRCENGEIKPMVIKQMLEPWEFSKKLDFFLPLAWVQKDGLWWHPPISISQLIYVCISAHNIYIYVIIS